VLGGWLVVGGSLAVLVSRAAGRKLAELPPGRAEEPEGAVRYALYAVSLLFWPAALAIGAWFLSKPETARAGKICLYLALGYFTFSVVVACAIVTAIALAFPEMFVV
jgi:hypothetical protein